MGIVAVATLEDLGVWTARKYKRFWLQRVIMELVEVTLIGELLVRPDAFETGDELAAAAVALPVVKPPLANARELSSG